MNDLQRFVDAQEDVFDTALAELKAGKKRTHWMWFIFPQMWGLGSSANAQFYGIASLEEARAYLAHELLGPRLLACTQAVLGVQGKSLEKILGKVDTQKFRSSMTLFLHVPGDPIFREALDRYCDGIEDEGTLALL